MLEILLVCHVIGRVDTNAGAGLTTTFKAQQRTRAGELLTLFTLLEVHSHFVVELGFLLMSGLGEFCRFSVRSLPTKLPCFKKNKIGVLAASCGPLGFEFLVVTARHPTPSPAFNLKSLSARPQWYERSPRAV